MKSTVTLDIKQTTSEEELLTPATDEDITAKDIQYNEDKIGNAIDKELDTLDITFESLYSNYWFSFVDQYKAYTKLNELIQSEETSMTDEELSKLRRANDRELKLGWVYSEKFVKLARKIYNTLDKEAIDLMNKNTYPGIFQKRPVMIDNNKGLIIVENMSCSFLDKIFSRLYEKAFKKEISKDYLLENLKQTQLEDKLKQEFADFLYNSPDFARQICSDIFEDWDISNRIKSIKEDLRDRENSRERKKELTDEKKLLFNYLNRTKKHSLSYILLQHINDFLINYRNKNS